MTIRIVAGRHDGREQNLRGFPEAQPIDVVSTENECASTLQERIDVGRDRLGDVAHLVECRGGSSGGVDGFTNTSQNTFWSRRRRRRALEKRNHIGVSDSPLLGGEQENADGGQVVSVQPEVAHPHLLGVFDHLERVVDGLPIRQRGPIDVLKRQVRVGALVAQSSGGRPFLGDASPWACGRGDGGRASTAAHLGMQANHGAQQRFGWKRGRGRIRTNEGPHARVDHAVHEPEVERVQWCAEFLEHATRATGGAVLLNVLADQRGRPIHV